MEWGTTGGGDLLKAQAACCYQAPGSCPWGPSFLPVTASWHGKWGRVGGSRRQVTDDSWTDRFFLPAQVFLHLWFPECGPCWCPEPRDISWLFWRIKRSFALSYPQTQD